VTNGATNGATSEATSEATRGMRFGPPCPWLPATQTARGKATVAREMMTAIDRGGGEVAEEVAADGAAMGMSRPATARSPRPPALNPIPARGRMMNQDPPDAAMTSRKLDGGATLRRATVTTIAVTYRMLTSTRSDRQLRKAMRTARDRHGSGGGVAAAVGVEGAEAGRPLSSQHRNGARTVQKRI